ncbi:MerR family mercuric resistance operon transcriptional regulator [Sphingomonas sp. PP-CE-3A-406]|jgi:MerR family mercuric resistance operon transcriptional regulator|uniref:MerR family DNA-binding protein n=1 Tax=Sphingomonas sp. PP-CE-3A-406 TaxID=2135659 RepID=UPI000F19B9E4|nr:MerR family DNA-binding protein [Sphingomonas sp. PP-CE-3A-406]RMB51388.1 MerR family mercuric resistance operon transcriptional regulator [Sphingomonas sp. PP-CE-3A-406]
MAVAGRSRKRGDVARRFRCNIETVRHYEKIGLLNAPDRTESGHRLYSADDEAQLAFILRGRQLGFSIDELRGLLSLGGSGSEACGEANALTQRHLADVRAKLRDLARLEKTLVAISARCEHGGGGLGCPILEALQAGPEGQ